MSIQSHDNIYREIFLALKSLETTPLKKPHYFKYMHTSFVSFVVNKVRAIDWLIPIYGSHNPSPNQSESLVLNSSHQWCLSVKYCIVYSTYLLTLLYLANTVNMKNSFSVLHSFDF